MIQMPDDAALAFMGAGITGWTTGKLRLFQSRNPVANPVYADFLFADYTGHSEPVPVWVDRVTDAGELGQTTAETFTPTGTAIANEIRGWAFTDVGGTEVFFFEDYDSPRQMASPDDVIYQSINLVLPSGQTWGYGVDS